MWRNYLITGFRALIRHKTYAFINIFGLAIGLAACLMILLYVRHETSYDSWLPDAERVYQVQTATTDAETGERREQQAAPRPTAEALAKNFPQIELISKAEGGRPTILSQGEPESGEMLLVDEPFFRILQVPFLRGDHATAMAGADSLAVSRSEALKRFGTVDALGRTLTIVADTGEKRDLKVTAVFEDLPKNSHLGFSLVTRFREEWECGWSCINGGAYLKLKPGADIEAINAQLPAWEKRNIPANDMGGAGASESDLLDFKLVNVRDVHLSPATGERPGNDRRSLITFSIIALLILGMAVVNFTNLATARAGQRAREVALRKVVGASRRQLVAQFLGESVLLTGIAMVIALALVELTLPAYAAFLDADLRLSYFGANGILPPVLSLGLAVGLLGGLYPAFYLSRYRPAAVLKANAASTDAQGSGRLRGLLVLAQFAVSIGLIVCTAVVYNQTVFARTTDPGFERDGLLIVEDLRRPETIPVREALQREIARIDGVTGVSGTSIVPGSRQTLYTMVQVPGKAEAEKIGWYSVEPSFFDTMKIRMVAGRKLSRAHAQDSGYIDFEKLSGEAAAAPAINAMLQRGINVVLNEQAARRLGFADPASALGKSFRLSLFGEGEGTTAATVVGIAADARFRSLREPVEPIVFYDVGYYSRLAIRYEKASPQAVRDQVERIWRRLLPEVPLTAEFADERLAELYEADARRGQTFAGFALLAVVIACLGLFGLAAFTAERRTKEIGIRKVFGARVGDIVQLLAWQFSKPVIVANLIAWPVAWWVMRDWLNGFDARIDLGPGPFVMAGALALAIALGTISGHAIKVARLNPIHALRYE
jgi:putative ABC transport system permease protein